MPQSLDALPFQVDHIRAIKHHGPTVLDNLALSCCDCNRFKGSDLSGFDLELNVVTRLYHPRSDVWHEHFQWDDAVLLGITPVGRVTIDVLNINMTDRVEHRRVLIAAGLFNCDQ